MEIIKIIFFTYLLPTIIGYLVIKIITERLNSQNKISFIEKIGLGYGLGSSLITLCFFCLNLVGLSLNLFYPLLLMILIFLLYLFTSGFKFKIGFSLSFFRHYNEKIPSISLFLAFIIYGLVLIFKATLTPMEDGDPVGIWGYKAKILYFHKGIPPEFYALDKHMHNLDHPLHLPILEAYFYLVKGDWDDAGVKLIMPLYLLSFLICTYSILFRHIHHHYALLGVFLIATTPITLTYSTKAFADIPMAYYACLSFFYLFEWVKSKDNFWVILSAILACGGIWTKREGLMVAAVNIFLANIFILKKDWRKLSSLPVYLSISLFPLIPWFIVKSKHHLHSWDIELGSLNLIRIKAIFIRLPVIINWFLRYLFGSSQYGLAWYFLTLILLMPAFAHLAKKDRVKKAILDFLLLPPSLFFLTGIAVRFGLAVLAYSLVVVQPEMLMIASLDRVLLPISFMAIFLFALFLDWLSISGIANRDY